MTKHLTPIMANGSEFKLRAFPFAPVLTSDSGEDDENPLSEAEGILALIGVIISGTINRKTLAASGNEGSVAMDELSELLPTITLVGLLAMFLVFEVVRR